MIEAIRARLARLNEDTAELDPDLPCADATVGIVRRWLVTDRDEIAAAIEDEMRAIVGLLVHPKHRAAVWIRIRDGWAGAFDRRPPVDRWPWPDHRTNPGSRLWGLRWYQDQDHDLRGLTATDDRIPPLATLWPAEVAPLDVALDVRDALNNLPPDVAPDLADLAGGVGDGWLSAVRGGSFLTGLELGPPKPGALRAIMGAAMALTVLTDRHVRAGLARTSMPVSTGRVSASVVNVFRDVTPIRENAIHEWSTTDAGHFVFGPDSLVELVDGGNATQLVFPWKRSAEGSERLIAAIKRLRSAIGIRHWCALLALWGIRGGRGPVRWSIDEHMQAMKLPKDEQQRPERRAKIVQEVWALTSLELRITAPDGRFEQRPLIEVKGKRGAIKNGEPIYDGLDFIPAGAIYHDVRREDGRIGSSWVPLPAELAGLDHKRHPYAIALGLSLGIRFGWDRHKKDGQVRLSGDKFLELAGITVTTSRPERGWAALRREIAALTEIGLIERVVWEGGAWSSQGRADIYPAHWLADRMVRDLRPKEKPAMPVMLNGTELRVWRESRGASQREAAALLHVTQGAISAAERGGDRRLSRAMSDAIRAAAS